MCAIVRELARTAGIEPTPPEWRSGTLPLSHVRKVKIDRLPLARVAVMYPSWSWWVWSWWVGMELNHHSSRGAFTTSWARQCPAYPRTAVLDHCCANWRKVKESNPRPRGRPGFRDRLRTT